jgi:cytochrome c oxidase cbb3-type subunit 2
MQKLFERHSWLLLIGILLVVSVGGIVEVLPLFWLKSTIEEVKGIRPYSPLELAGRDIYVREGCYLCHSQMIRSLRDEVERYGHYSLAAESMYDHPFQWGSKRTGPDLARVGGKYDDRWHALHMINPREVVKESVMPGYPFLGNTKLDYTNIQDKMKTLSIVGVPYTKEQIDNAVADLKAQANPESEGAAAVAQRYPKAQVRHFYADNPDPKDKDVTELDAVIAYLQVLGTMVEIPKGDLSGPALR